MSEKINLEGDAGSTESPNKFIGIPKKTSTLFSSLIFITFFWIITGISILYGIRMWMDVRIDPSFIPIIGAAFAAALAFTLVLALEYASGPIKFHAANIKFEGASGPIILWCICFTAIVFGLYLLGLPEVVTLESAHEPRLIPNLFSP